MSGTAAVSIWPEIRACTTVLSSSNRVSFNPGTATRCSALSWLEPRLTPMVLFLRSSRLFTAAAFLAMMAIWNALYGWVKSTVSARAGVGARLETRKSTLPDCSAGMRAGGVSGVSSAGTPMYLAIKLAMSTS